MCSLDRSSFIQLYSANFGNRDPFYINHVENQVVYRTLFTDKECSLEWAKILEMNVNISNRYKARSIKLLPHRWLSKKCDWYVWHDASMEPVVRWDLPNEVKNGSKDIYAHRHRFRNTVIEEFEHCIECSRDDPKIIKLQRNRYSNLGVLSDKLFETGILYIRNNPVSLRAMEIWFEEVTNFSIRDQLSFGYAAKLAGCEIGSLRGNVESAHGFTFHLKEHKSRYIPWPYKR